MPSQLRHPLPSLLALPLLPLLLIGCQTGEPDLLARNGDGGISFSAPVVGAQETYAGYQYGTLAERETVKTYTGDSLTLKVLSVDANAVGLEESLCQQTDSTCLVQELRLDRKTGKIQVVQGRGYSLLMAANEFSSGIFSEDPAKSIAFDGYAPRAQGPTVGVAAEFRVGSRTYRNVTVLADPTDIPVDGGGKCLVLTRDDRLVEIIHYHVFGVDGGWEMRE